MTTTTRLDIIRGALAAEGMRLAYHPTTDDGERLARAIDAALHAEVTRIEWRYLDAAEGLGARA